MAGYLQSKHMKFEHLALCFLLFSTTARAQDLPQVSAGSIHRLENFASKYVDARNIDVWMPADYTPGKKYNVVYMHDGQMLFDASKTWNQQEWEVDETFTRLIKEKKIERCIVVGIWNNGQYRHAEYFPQAFLNTLTPAFRDAFVAKELQNKPQSDAYLKFIVEELKPYIDRNFATYPDKDATFIMGSSMGGLISMYAISEYPAVFGGAACLSVAWVAKAQKNFELPLAAFNYLQKKTPSPFGHKIYMDHGTTEMDTMYGVYQDFVDILMQNKGFGPGNFKSAAYPGTGHNEKDWAARLSVPVQYLLGKPPLQQVAFGKLDHYADFQSKYVTERNVDVWLPENYDPKIKYPVLYMHDGQMLFDPNTTWNKTSWNVDDVLTEITQTQKVKNAIVVGIWNGGKTRHADYFPQKPFESLSAEKKEMMYAAARAGGASVFNHYEIHSDDYLKFIVTELKPFIDKTYPTLPDRKNTFVAGSSMGGLISLYAICEYPEVFGGAACLSTHWPGIFTLENNPFPAAYQDYLRLYLPNPKTHSIYFDCGDQTLDAMYPTIQKQVDALMRIKGFTAKNWMTKYFPGEDHSERAWNKRFDVPMVFLLKK